MYSLCLCLFVSTLSPALVEMLSDSRAAAAAADAAAAAAAAVAGVSAQINAWSFTVLCCNALDSSSLRLMHSLPLSVLLPPCSLFFLHLRSVTREETQWEPRI